jgi:hypothetical protein
MARLHTPREVMPAAVARALDETRYWFVIGGQAVRCFCPYRPSDDVDFGVANARDAVSLLAQLGKHGRVEVLERAPDTVHLTLDGVPVSIFVLARVAPHTEDGSLTVTGVLATKHFAPYFLASSTRASSCARSHTSTTPSTKQRSPARARRTGSASRRSSRGAWVRCSRRLPPRSRSKAAWSTSCRRRERHEPELAARPRRSAAEAARRCFARVGAGYRGLESLVPKRVDTGFGRELVQPSYLNESDTRAVRHDLAVLDLHVELGDFGDAQVAQRFSRRLDRRLRGVLPGDRAGADDLGDAIDR